MFISSIINTINVVAKWTCAMCGRPIPFGGRYCALCSPKAEGHHHHNH